jgi:hypothetical protein
MSISPFASAAAAVTVRAAGVAQYCGGIRAPEVTSSAGHARKPKIDILNKLSTLLSRLTAPLLVTSRGPLAGALRRAKSANYTIRGEIHEGSPERIYAH